MSKYVDRDDDYDNDDKHFDNGDGHIDLEGPEDHIQNISGKLIGYKHQKNLMNWGLVLKLMISQG